MNKAIRDAASFIALIVLSLVMISNFSKRDIYLYFILVYLWIVEILLILADYFNNNIFFRIKRIIAELTKTWFTFMEWLLIVSAISFVAIKTENSVLTYIVYISYFLIIFNLILILFDAVNLSTAKFDLSRTTNKIILVSAGALSTWISIQIIIYIDNIVRILWNQFS